MSDNENEDTVEVQVKIEVVLDAAGRVTLTVGPIDGEALPEVLERMGTEEFLVMLTDRVGQELAAKREAGS